MSFALKAIFVANVRRLLGIPEGESGVSVVMKKDFANGTAQRILNAEVSIGFDLILQVAQRLGVQPWQLFVPDLDPDRLPTLEPASFRWPFRKIDPEVVTGLVGTAAQQIENGLLVSLATLGIAPRQATKAAPIPALVGAGVGEIPRNVGSTFVVTSPVPTGDPDPSPRARRKQNAKARSDS